MPKNVNLTSNQLKYFPHRSLKSQCAIEPSLTIVLLFLFSPNPDIYLKWSTAFTAAAKFLSSAASIKTVHLQIAFFYTIVFVMPLILTLCLMV